MELQIGQRIHVYEFVYDEQNQINYDIIRTGWQAVCDDTKAFPFIMGIDGKMHSAWSDEVSKIGTLVVSKLPCHICGVKTDFICERCERYMCERCQAPYNQFSQIDYNCCTSCY